MDTSDPVAAPPDDDEPRGRALRKGRREKGKVAGQREAGGGARKEGGGARRHGRMLGSIRIQNCLRSLEQAYMGIGVSQKTIGPYRPKDEA